MLRANHNAKLIGAALLLDAEELDLLPQGFPADSQDRGGALAVQWLQSALNERTRVVFVETPANPTLAVTDIAAAAEIAHRARALLIAASSAGAKLPMPQVWPAGIATVFTSTAPF